MQQDFVFQVTMYLLTGRSKGVKNTVALYFGSPFTTQPAGEKVEGNFLYHKNEC